jgi:hypothetical protein
VQKTIAHLTDSRNSSNPFGFSITVTTSSVLIFINHSVVIIITASLSIIVQKITIYCGDTLLKPHKKSIPENIANTRDINKKKKNFEQLPPSPIKKICREMAVVNNANINTPEADVMIRTILFELSPSPTKYLTPSLKE